MLVMCVYACVKRSGFRPTHQHSCDESSIDSKTLKKKKKKT